jgi:hypothetical protein
MADTVAGMPATAQKHLFDNLQRIKRNLVATEPKTAVADEPIGRTNRDARRKPTRLQRAR